MEHEAYEDCDSHECSLRSFLLELTPSIFLDLLYYDSLDQILVYLTFYKYPYQYH